MTMNFEIDDGFIAEQNRKLITEAAEDYAHLAKQLHRRNIDIESLTGKAQSLRVAIPSWGVGTGGTRFARFPGAAEPRDVFEKIEDCAAVQQLARSTPTVSLHIPWDKPENVADLKRFAEDFGLGFDAMNSNT